MEPEYEMEEDYAPRILWGRLAFFFLALVLAFAVGRCTKSEGVSQERYNEQAAQVMELKSENEVLKVQLDAATSDGGGGGEQTEEPQQQEEEAAAEEEPTEGGSVEEGQTYTVKSGDTLTRIAQEFYGDPRKYELIVDANNLDSATGLRVGQELVIPPDD